MAAFPSRESSLMKSYQTKQPFSRRYQASERAREIGKQSGSEEAHSRELARLVFSLKTLLVSVQSDWNKFLLFFCRALRLIAGQWWWSQMKQCQGQVCLKVYTASTQIPTRDQTLNKPWTETLTFSRNFLCPQSKNLFSLSGRRGTTQHHNKVNFFTTPRSEKKVQNF